MGLGFASASESLCYTYCLKCSQKSSILACPKCTCKQVEKTFFLVNLDPYSLFLSGSDLHVQYTIDNAFLKGREQDKKLCPFNLKCNSLESPRFPSISWKVESTLQFMSRGRPWLLLHLFQLMSCTLGIAQGCC